MPSLDTYKKLHKGKTNGQIHKKQSDMIMEATWDNDINSRILYFYDQDHDDEFELADHLQPYKCNNKIPVEAKLYEIEYNSLSKDTVSHHIVFKPSFDIENITPYYQEKFGKPLGALSPIGLYFDAEDSNGVYHRWMVVGEYRYYSNQFPSYLVLPCDYKLQWIYNQKKYESWVCLRSQSSYNSGLWTDYRFTEPENQKIVWLSFNDQTVNLFYDTRVVISEPRPIPVCWSVSKVEDMNVKGIIRLTMKQDKFNPHTDYIEKDEEQNVIGMWCNYYDSKIEPKDANDPTVPTRIVDISYNGITPEVKVQGSFTVFTVTMYDGTYDDIKSELPFEPGDWEFTIDGNDVSDMLEIQYPDNANGLDQNQIAIRFVGPDIYIGEILLVKYRTNKDKGADYVSSGYIEMSIVGL